MEKNDSMKQAKARTNAHRYEPVRSKIAPPDHEPNAMPSPKVISRKPRIVPIFLPLKMSPITAP